MTFQTADAPPNVYQMEVTSKPTITLKRVALGSGDLGPPINMTISSDLSAYLPLTGGTLTGPLTGRPRPSAA